MHHQILERFRAGLASMRQVARPAIRSASPRLPGVVFGGYIVLDASGGHSITVNMARLAGLPGRRSDDRTSRHPYLRETPLSWRSLPLPPKPKQPRTARQQTDRWRSAPSSCSNRQSKSTGPSMSGALPRLVSVAPLTMQTTRDEYPVTNTERSFGRTSAPTMPKFMHTRHGPNKGA
jgi:hypothetical protein